MKELHEANTPLDEPSCEQAVVRKRCLTRLGPIELERFRRLSLQIHQLRDAGLHAEGHLVLGYAGGDLGIVDIGKLLTVERLNRVEQAAAVGAGNTGRIGKKE